MWLHASYFTFSLMAKWDVSVYAAFMWCTQSVFLTNRHLPTGENPIQCACLIVQLLSALLVTKKRKGVFFFSYTLLLHPGYTQRHQQKRNATCQGSSICGTHLNNPNDAGIPHSLHNRVLLSNAHEPMFHIIANRCQVLSFSKARGCR